MKAATWSMTIRESWPGGDLVSIGSGGRACEGARNLKRQFGLAPECELKWVKVSKGRQEYYEAVLDWFWNTPDLHFRCLIVPDKSKLDHEVIGQTHDDWYYKMYFNLLKVIIDPQQRYNVYLDLKDTRGAAKVRKLHEVLSNAQYDFSRSIIQRIQLVRSHEVELLQLADYLTGLIAYANRGLHGSKAKLALVAAAPSVFGLLADEDNPSSGR